MSSALVVFCSYSECAHMSAPADPPTSGPVPLVPPVAPVPVPPTCTAAPLPPLPPEPVLVPPVVGMTVVPAVPPLPALPACPEAPPVSPVLGSSLSPPHATATSAGSPTRSHVRLPRATMSPMVVPEYSRDQGSVPLRSKRSGSYAALHRHEALGWATARVARVLARSRPPGASVVLRSGWSSSACRTRRRAGSATWP